MKKNRTYSRIVIITIFLAVNVLILFGISQILVYLNTGADRAKMFQTDLKKEGFYVPEVIWLDLENPGRPIEVPTQKTIEKDYLNAWYARSVALKTHSTDLLENAYTERARENIHSSIEKNKTDGVSIDFTTLSHNISLDFYSADGNLIVITDQNVKSFERVYKNDIFLLETEEESSYKVIMLKEDGFWRIRHMEKFQAEAKLPIAATPFLFPKVVSGLNYYPQNTPWDTFGSDFSLEILKEDFTLINELNLNTIRIFIGYEDFGNAKVSTEKLAKLRLLLDVAETHNLKVLITLFDFYGDYSVLDWTRTQKHALTVVKAVKDHPALLGWDIKNEPDLDFNTRGTSLVKAWLSHMLKTVKKTDPNHPVTIGWSSVGEAIQLEKEVDYISFHYYQDLENLSRDVSELKTKTEKPIVLQEFGLSSYKGLWNPFGNSEEDQAEFYEEFLEIQKRDSINYLSWTLFDFPAIPNEVAGILPWRKSKQTEFGLINKTGAKKAAFDVVKNK